MVNYRENSNYLIWLLGGLLTFAITVGSLEVCSANAAIGFWRQEQEGGDNQTTNRINFNNSASQDKKIDNRQNSSVQARSTSTNTVQRVDNLPKSSNRYYQVIYYHIMNTNSKLRIQEADWMAKSIISCCNKWKVQPLLATALFTQESGFDMHALSPTGAVGIAQLQPETAAALGVNPFNAAQNIEGGIMYLSEQLATFRYAGAWNASYAIAAYNAGPGKVKEYNGIPPYSETINHVKRVGSILQKLEGAYRLV